MRKIIFSLVLLSVFSLVAQEKIDFVDYDSVLKNVTDFSNKKEYSKVIEELNKIHKNDSIHDSVLVLKSYYQLENKDFDKALETIDLGLSLGNDGLRYSFYLNKGVAYLRSEQYQKAVEVYTKAIKEFPKNYMFFYNRGVAYEGLEKLEEAANNYKKSITLNPFYHKSHLQLGKIAYVEQKMGQALMALNMHLLLNPDGEGTSSVLSSIDISASRKNASEPTGITLSKDDSYFEEIDLILNNGIALNPNYQINSKINIALNKQNHALFEQLKDFEGEDGFWSQKYVPFYKWVFDNNYFDDFTYTICYSIENPNFKKIISKNTAKISSFIDLFYDKWTEVNQGNIELYQGKKQKVKYVFTDYVLKAIGKSKGEVNIGAWEIYDQEGKLSGKGIFDEEGRRQGEWLWYDPNGKISEEENYEKGKLEGAYASYHSNGNHRKKLNYKEGKLHGISKLYNDEGALIEEKNFEKGELQGIYQSFHKIGAPYKDYELTYQKDKVEGSLKRYYASGELFDQAVYKEGKIIGEENLYYQNKEKRATYNYGADGQYQGVYTTYYNNGKIYELGNTLEGYYHGDWKIYYKNGTLKKEMTYNKGRLVGLYKEYDIDGKLYEEFEYKNDQIIAFKYYNKDGSIVKEDRKKKGTFYYQGYSVLGNMIAEGLYDIKGGKSGIWKFYDDGVLESKGEYKDNMLKGTYKTYFKNGKEASISFYKKDSLDGYYVSYYKNRKIKQQGWYKGDQPQGVWHRYYPDGTLKEENYYYKGKFNGAQKYYGVEGTLYKTEYYEFDKLLSEIYFRSDGKELEKLSISNLGEDYVLKTKHFNGSIYSEINYKYGVKHGKYSKYNFNGEKVAEGTYFNGKPEGSWIWYHENRQIAEKRNYKSGKIHGIKETYHETGTLKTKSVYDSGKLHGLYEEYTETGILIRSTQYVYDVVHGERKFFSPEGDLQLIRYYHNDKLIGYSYNDTSEELKPMIPITKQTGIIKAYFDNGTVSAEMEFDKGNLVNSYKTYYKSGQVSRSINYKDGDYHGINTYYYSDGTVQKQMQYEYDHLQGMYLENYANGNTKKEVNYILDQESGEARFFNEKGNVIKKQVYFNGQIETEEKYE